MNTPKLNFTSRLGLITLIVGLSLAIVGLALAETNAAALDWGVIGAGGGPVDNGNGTAINATLGQPVIGSSSNGTTAISSGYWQEGQGPTAVNLAFFRAISYEDSIQIEWETVLETQTQGFNLYRSESEM